MSDKRDTKKPKAKLTDQQQLFVLEYLECWNATEAYLASHPKCHSRGAASVGGATALVNPNIRAAIDARLNNLLGIRMNICRAPIGDSFAPESA